MISKDEIEKLAGLCRIAVTAPEIEKLRGDIDNILSYVGELSSVPLEQGEGKEKPIIKNVMREDDVPHESGKFSQNLLSAAPEKKGDYVAVKKIL